MLGSALRHAHAELGPILSAMSQQSNGLQMIVPAQAENVAVVRHALAGLAEEIGMDEAGMADLKTVVTEACMNVVVHAYDGQPGPLMVEAQPGDEGLDVVVRDMGRGIRPQADVERPSLRLGLSLIAALSSRFAISGGLGRGTEISMLLPLRGSSANGSGPAAGVDAVYPAGTELVVSDPNLLAPVLARTVGALAARRDISVDRLSDAMLLTDALAAVAPGNFADDCVRLSLVDRENGIELHLGPMEMGAAQEMREKLEVPEVGGSLEALADGLGTEESGEGEYLVIRFSAAAV